MWNHNLWTRDEIRRVLIKSSKRIRNMELWKESLYANDTLKEYIFIKLSRRSIWKIGERSVMYGSHFYINVTPEALGEKRLRIFVCSKARSFDQQYRKSDSRNCDHRLTLQKYQHHCMYKFTSINVSHIFFFAKYESCIIFKKIF